SPDSAARGSGSSSATPSLPPRRRLSAGRRNGYGQGQAQEKAGGQRLDRRQSALGPRIFERPAAGPAKVLTAHARVDLAHLFKVGPLHRAVMRQAVANQPDRLHGGPKPPEPRVKGVAFEKGLDRPQLGRGLAVAAAETGLPLVPVLGPRGVPARQELREGNADLVDHRQEHRRLPPPHPVIKALAPSGHFQSRRVPAPLPLVVPVPQAGKPEGPLVQRRLERSGFDPEAPSKAAPDPGDEARLQLALLEVELEQGII